MSLFAEDDNFEPSHEGTGTLTEPRLMNRIVGHDTIEQNLLTAIAENRLPHGLIFSGLKGIGKSTFACRLTKFLLTQNTDPNQDSLFGDAAPATAPTSMDTDPAHPDVRLFLAGAHPDILIAERAYDDAKNKYKASIDVAEIRKITPFLRKTSSDAGWRVVIVDDADTMNRNAQNAILKILEEPPKRTIIILIAHRAGNLIPTIKSRTQTINFAPLSNEALSTLIDQSEFPPAAGQKQTLIDLAGGSIGRAIGLMEEEGIEMIQTVTALISTKPDWDAIHKTADSLARNGQDKAYAQFQSALKTILHTLCKSKARNAPLPNHLKNLQPLTDQKPLTDLLTLTNTLNTLLDRSTYANLDKKSTILQAITLITT